jgi:putative FmdB family regulatory protein
MPIYAYKCETCGHAKDVLQKLSDTPLSDCPACGAPTFKKQLTAAGFQLKGSGWYVTDFRNGNSGAAPAKPEEKAPSTDQSGESKAADAAPAAPGKSETVAPTTAPASAAPVAITPTSAGTPPKTK